jgi:hypothetical protein
MKKFSILFCCLSFLIYCNCQVGEFIKVVISQESNEFIFKSKVASKNISFQDTLNLLDGTELVINGTSLPHKLTEQLSFYFLKNEIVFVTQNAIMFYHFKNNKLKVFPCHYGFRVIGKSKKDIYISTNSAKLSKVDTNFVHTPNAIYRINSKGKLKTYPYPKGTPIKLECENLKVCCFDKSPIFLSQNFLILLNDEHYSMSVDSSLYIWHKKSFVSIKGNFSSDSRDFHEYNSELYYFDFLSFSIHKFENKKFKIHKKIDLSQGRIIDYSFAGKYIIFFKQLGYRKYITEVFSII